MATHTDSNVLTMKRSASQELAMKLRDLARRIESGDVKYVAVYAINTANRIEEFTIDALRESRARQNPRA